MNRPPAFFDHIIALPLPLLGLFLLAYWFAVAGIVHWYMVPWIAGRDGLKLGRLEAEVPAQIGLAFGLLVSFIAVPVWDQHNQAIESARAEAAAYREMAEAIDDGEAPQNVKTHLQECVAFLLDNEWPKMAHLDSPRFAAPPLRDLRGAIHALPESQLQNELQDLLKQAATARDSRLRIAASRPPPARWMIIGLLAVLTLLGVGLIHAESRRGRRVALSMVAIGISCCFVVLFAYTRPYLGQFAVIPEDLQSLASDLQSGSGSWAQTPPPVVR